MMCKSRMRPGSSSRADRSEHTVPANTCWWNMYLYTFTLCIFTLCHILILTLVKRYYQRPNNVSAPLLLSEQDGLLETAEGLLGYLSPGWCRSSVLSDFWSNTFLTQMLIGLRSGKSTPQTVVVLLKPDS